MGLLLGATVYTFSIILAVFLVGIGVGSAVGSALSRTAKPRAAIGVCQLLLAGAVAWTAYMISQSVPWWPVNPLLNQNPWFTFQVDMVRSLWAILPATLLWGASFPLALAAASRGAQPGELVGGIYAANTGGAILGALTFSMILVPAIGTANCERVLIALAALSALVVLVPYLVSSRAKAGWVALAASVVAIVYLISGVTPVPPLLDRLRLP